MRKSLPYLFFNLCWIITALAQTPYSQAGDRFLGPWSTAYHDFPIENNYQEKLDLQDLTDTDTLPVTALSFSRSNQTRNIWGRGEEIDAVFDKEYLPAFFERELIFDQFEAGSGLVKWVFTGNEGGWTVQISRDSIHLYQRFYNSFGFHEVLPSKSARNYRHPNKVWLVSATKIEGGPLKTVKISTDAYYNIQLEVNGKEVAKQTTRIDVFRNQIQFEKGIGAISGRLKKPQAMDVSVQILSKEKHQEILGFGGIASVPAYHELSKEGKNIWWKLIQEYNLLIQREYPVGQMLNESYSNWDDLSVASPHYYGDNFPNGEISDFDYNKKIIELGGHIVFSFWKLPEILMKEDGTVNTSKYAAAIVSYCKTLKTKSGAYPLYVGIQNEVVKDGPEWHKMTRALRAALDANGMKQIKIMMFNAPMVRKAIPAIRAFKEDLDVWNTVDYAGSNMYDYNALFKTPWNYDSLLLELKKEIKNKPFISPELSINWNDFLMHSYRTAFSMAMLYHKNMVILNAISLQYCWTLLNTPQEGFDMTRTLMGVDEKNGFLPFEQGFQLRTFGAFSKHLPQGTVRLGASSSHENILISAYKNKQGKVAILLNKGKIPARITFNTPFRNLERVSWSANGKKEAFTNPILLKPGELVTVYQNL